jgi:hypothetical protein
MKLNEPQNIEQNFDELELVAEKAGELNDRVGKIENELGAQTKTLESAAMVLDAAIKGLGALKHQVLENDIGALQLALNDKTAHLAREIGRFESAVAEIDRRAEAGDEQLAASLRDIALGLRSSFDAKSVEIAEWSVRVEREIAAHSVALAAIPPVIKGADAKPFNPRGEWQAGMIANSLDVVSYNGSSYISNEDGNTEKPTRSTKYTTLAKRSGNGAGGATDFGSLTGTILPAQVVPGSATYAVGDVLYAGTTGALSKLAAGTSGQLLSTQGAGAAPIWVSATGGAGDVNGPGSATDNAIVRFDGTGGKTVQNSTVIIGDTGAITGVESLKSSTSGGLAIIGSGGTTVATFGPGAGTGVAFNSSGLTSVNSVTAASTTDLTLASGSTGASLVLGQGTTAGTITLTPTGSGTVAIAGAKKLRPSGDIYFSATNPFVYTDIATNLTGLEISGNSAYLNLWTNNVERARLTSTGNLLIGTTTDATSLSGGLVVNGSGSGAAASGPGTGALRVTGGSYVSGAGYFGGTINTTAATGNPTISATITAAGGAGQFPLFQLIDSRASGATWNMENGRTLGSFALRSSGSGDVLTMTSTGAATFAGAVTVAGTVIHTLSATPASASATGTVGTMSWDANYIYICTATNTWKRVAIATW